MVAHFREGFSKIFVIAQVCYFFFQLVHITWHTAKVLYFFDFFWITYARFKMRSKRRAWPFLARGWVLQKYHWIYDEIYICEAKNDFWEKSWTYYEAPVVQIWPISNWFDRSLSFSWEIYGNHWTLEKLIICA
jgi:hypothetical protein